MPLFIYADNIKNNIKKIKNKSQKDLIAVVKSNAYGIGAKKVINILKEENVNFFAFEKMKEFLEVKPLLEDSKVLIMQKPSNFIISKNHFSNVRYSINSLLDAILLKDIKVPVIVHLQMDTGMNRVGIRSIKELKWVISTLTTNELIKIEGIYTHFSSDFYESKYFKKQVNMFKKCLNIYPFEIIHANATKSLHKMNLGNYLRVGMAIYGYHQPHYEVVPSVSITEKPIKIFNSTSNDLIGYSQLSTKNTIAIINLGYNDFDFSLINELYKGRIKYKIFGKSCMNHTHIICDDKINYLTWLSFFPTNDIIISSDDYDWYRILISTKSMPKNYIMRRYYDIPTIFKTTSEKSFRTKFRGRSNKITHSRII